MIINVRNVEEGMKKFLVYLLVLVAGSVFAADELVFLGVARTPGNFNTTWRTGVSFMFQECTPSVWPLVECDNRFMWELYWTGGFWKEGTLYIDSAYTLEYEPDIVAAFGDTWFTGALVLESNADYNMFMRSYTTTPGNYGTELHPVVPLQSLQWFQPSYMLDRTNVLVFNRSDDNALLWLGEADVWVIFPQQATLIELGEMGLDSLCVNCPPPYALPYDPFTQLHILVSTADNITGDSQLVPLFELNAPPAKSGEITVHYVE